MHQTKEEQLLYKRFCELSRVAYQRGICMYSEFTGLAGRTLAWQAVAEQYSDLPEQALPITAYGGYEEAERVILCFLPDRDSDIPLTECYPLRCVRIAPVNRRFGEDLSHRDYLGTIMGLGLERDQIGDILVRQEGTAGAEATVGYVFCKANKAELLTDLTRIRHTTVTAEVIEPGQLHWEQKYKDISGSVSSLRLDAVIAVAIRTSRTQGLQLVRDGNIYINGKCCTENAKLLQDGDVISVRGHGKYRFRYTGSQSKKGRYQITVQQYI
ncbi:MAG: RNA-binding protein [Lachnospiraceae bacterium]|nr:RNA-binding protein [Lachnospiraceae bacterium]